MMATRTSSCSAGPDAGVTYTIRDLEGHVLRRYLESNNVWTWKEDSIWGPNGLLATVSLCCSPPGLGHQ